MPTTEKNLSEIEILDAIERCKTLGCNTMNLETLACEKTGSSDPLIIEEYNSFDFSSFDPNTFKIPVELRNMPTFCEGMMNQVEYKPELFTGELATFFSHTPLVEDNHEYSARTQVGWIEDPKLADVEFNGKKNKCITSTWKIWDKPTIIRILSMKQDVGVSPAFTRELLENKQVSGKILAVEHVSFTLKPANQKLKINTNQKMTDEKQCQCKGLPEEQGKSIPVGNKEGMAKAVAGLSQGDFDMLTEVVTTEAGKRNYAFPNKEKPKTGDNYSPPPSDAVSMKEINKINDSISGLKTVIESLSKEVGGLTPKVDGINVKLESTSDKISDKIEKTNNKIEALEKKPEVQETKVLSPDETKILVKTELEAINEYSQAIVEIETGAGLLPQTFVEQRLENLKGQKLEALKTIHENYALLHGYNTTVKKAGETRITATTQHSVDVEDDVIDKPFPHSKGLNQ